MLRVCSEKVGFAKVVCLKVCDYMADFHIWISACSCPNPSSFTRCQRLSVCALLLLGYACVSTFLISQHEGKLYLELDVRDLSVIGVTTGFFSVVLVFPAATLVSFLFRLSEVKILRPEIKCSEETRTGSVCLDDASLTNSLFETHFSWSVLQRWLQETWRKKYQDTDLSSVSSWYQDDGDLNKIQNNTAISKEDVIVIDGVDETQDSCLSTDEKNTNNSPNKAERRGQVLKENLRLSHWCKRVAWILWLMLCLSGLAASAVLGVRFNSKEATLWIQSLFFSLLFCIFFMHPLLVFTMALVVSVRYRNGPDNPTFSTHYMHKSIHEAIHKCTLHKRTNPTFLQLLEARQRVRYLRLVRPPTWAELRKSRCERKRDAIIHQTVWDRCVFASMLVLLLCATCGSSSSDYYNLNKAVRKHFISNGFMSVRSYGAWWSWAQTSLINALYRNTTTKFAAFQESHILIGEPVLWKTEVRSSKAFSSTLLLNCYLQMWKTSTLIVKNCSEIWETPKMETTEANFSLGHTRILAESKLKQLHSQDGAGRSTVALKVHFALYSPAPNTFTSVTLSFKPSACGVLQPAASVQSVTVFHVGSEWDYAVVTCKILSLILLFLRLCHQMLDISEKGLITFCKIPRNWLEVALSVVATVYYIHTIYCTVLVGEVAEMLQRQNYKTHIDFTSLAAWDQSIRSLCGALLFLLTLRCVTFPTRSIFGILIAGLAVVAAPFCLGDNFHSSGSRKRAKYLNSRGNVRCRGMPFVLIRLVWTVGIINVVLSSVKSRWRRKDTFTTTDFVQYIKDKLFSWTRSAHSDHNTERKTYYFEQFESVLDELLLRLDAISDQTLPSEVRRHKQDSPVSLEQDNSKVETELYPETNATQPPEMSVPHDFNYLQSNDQEGWKISKGITHSDKVHEDETKCGKNAAARRVEGSQGPRTLTPLRPVSAEMVVEVLIHEAKH